MKEKIKVLIGDDSRELGLAAAGLMKNDDFFVITRKNNGKAILKTIKDTELPEVLALHYELEDMRVDDLLFRIQELESRLPIVIVIADGLTRFEEYTLSEAGADYIMKDGADPERLARKIKSMYRFYTGRDGDRSGQERINLEYTVTELMHRIGIPAHIKGYHYIRAAIIMAVENNEILESMTKQLYPAVAEQFDTTDSRVERAIRHAVGIAWERGNEEILSELFGKERKKPTNSEFIALIADKIRLRYAYDLRL